MPQVIFSSILMIAAFILYFILLFKPQQNEKNNRKKEAEKRRSIDELFDKAPTGFTQTGYASFEDSPIMGKCIQAWFQGFSKAGRK